MGVAVALTLPGLVLLLLAVAAIDQLLLRIRRVRTRGSLVLLGVLTAILAFQTWGLYPPLDERTRLIIAGTLPLQTWHHLGFVLTEGTKALLLAILTGAQIQAFAQAVVSD